MLYDPKWEAETKVDPWSLEALIAWLKTKPANARYCYTDTGHCLIAQYLIDLGYENVEVGAYGKWDADGARGQLHQFSDIANAPGEETFGKALKRARAAR